MQQTKRNSAGIILVRLVPGQPSEVLVVQKRCTYAFADFVCGRTEASERALSIAFSAMTREELLRVRSLDFQQIWFHLYTCTNYHSDAFKKAQARFAATHLQRDRRKQRLLRLVDNAHATGRPPWDFPRGGIKRGEYLMDAAVRELHEETGIERSEFRLLPEVQRRITRNTATCEYTFHYFVGVMTRDSKLRRALCFSESTGEIGDVRWVTLNALELLIKNAPERRAARAAVQCARRFVHSRVRNDASERALALTRMVAQLTLARSELAAPVLLEHKRDEEVVSDLVEKPLPLFARAGANVPREG